VSGSLRMGEVIKMSDTQYKILALDQGTITGWAYGFKDEEFGSIEFINKNKIERWVEFCEWLDRFIKEIKPFTIVIEKPFFRGKSSDYLMAFANMSKVVAHKNEVAHMEVHGMTIKRHAGVKQGKLVNQAKDRGWNVSDDHQADALFLLDYVKKNGEIKHGV